jgi:hypothetical protein
MGKRTKLREAQRHATEQAMAARLRAHARTNNGPAFVTSYDDFPPAYRQRIEPYRARAVRAPEAWRCQLRCRAPERRFLELVEFAFARYPVADHLKNAWIAPADARHELAAALNITRTNDFPDLRRWYIIAASGGSLYKEVTHRYLTKLETHHFVGAPAEVTSTLRAFWYAIARAEGDEPVACKVARSKLVEFPITSPFWREVAQFFARHPTAVIEMNDLVDYLQVARLEDPRFSLKGRGWRRCAAGWRSGTAPCRRSIAAGAGMAITCPTRSMPTARGSRSGASIKSRPARSSPRKAVAWRTASRATKSSACTA